MTFFAANFRFKKTSQKTKKKLKEKTVPNARTYNLPPT
jgi:hypothetical protein